MYGVICMDLYLYGGVTSDAERCLNIRVFHLSLMFIQPLEEMTIFRQKPSPAAKLP